MKTIELTCDNCTKTFVKDLREYKRRIKCGKTNFFCSQSCANTKNNEKHPRGGDATRLTPGNRRDEFTPFRWFILRSKQRDKLKSRESDITVEFLKQLWDYQAQTCPLTGWTMILPQDTNGWKEHHPANASIDRIDNAKGYTKDNVRFISIIANYARNQWTDSELFAFCKSVVKRNPYV